VLLIGTSLAVVGVALAFFSLLATYVSVRADTIAETGTWLPEGVQIPLIPATVGLVTLAMSAVTMQWAIHAIGERDRTNAYVALGVTLLLGVAFVNGTVFLYTEMGLGIADSAAAVLIYGLSGGHLAMTIAGLVFIALMAFRALGGQYAGRDREGVTAAAVFWYATVALYPALWYAVYVTK
jgi:cytochrome c oxidase subunit 3